MPEDVAPGVAGLTTVVRDAAAPEYSAVLLCGGGSRRFAGGDKALARVGGRRSIDRVLDAARALTDDIVLACGPTPRYAELGWPLALDAPDVANAAGVGEVAAAADAVGAAAGHASHTGEADAAPARGAGPLVGLAAGLVVARGALVFLLAVDLPLVTPAALRVLRDARGGRAAVMPESGGRLHPLCALVQRDEARAAVARILAGGPRAPRRLADELDTLRLAVGPPVTGDPLALALFNVNTDEDQLRAEELLAGG